MCIVSDMSFLRKSVCGFCVSAKPRVVSFDLPASIDSTRLAERERLRKKRGSDVSASAQHQLDEYFPTSVISPQETALVEGVKRPNLWLTDNDNVCIDDVGRFWRFTRSDLMRLLPEGLAGELSRDIVLMPSRTRDIGIMHRKTSSEILMQLSMMESGLMGNKSGWLLEGKRGTGKSAILNTVVAAARNRGWLVLFEPMGSRFGKEICQIVRSANGLYLQNQLAKEFLERFVTFNQDMLMQIPVQSKFYGRTSIDGSPIEMIERVYLPQILEKLDSSTTTLSEQIKNTHKLRSKLVVASMKDRCPNPANVYEICEFGINNMSFATQAVGELLNQLKVQENFPVLIAVDEYNEMMTVSEYVSTRYDNTQFNGYIPNYHLALSRMLSRWDGHEYKRGIKLVATSWNRRNRRQWDPTLLKINNSQIKQVRNFTKNEFEHFCAYQALTNTSKNFPETKIDYFYMLTQGNGFETRKIMATLH